MGGPKVCHLRPPGERRFLGHGGAGAVPVPRGGVLPGLRRLHPGVRRELPGLVHQPEELDERGSVGVIVNCAHMSSPVLCSDQCPTSKLLVAAKPMQSGQKMMETK